MKFNKNTIQVITLVISAFGLMITMALSLFNSAPDETIMISSDVIDVIILVLAIVLVIITFALYALLIIRRINPKKYIYLSFSESDKGIAEKIGVILEEQFRKLSKYRFEILSVDSIPYGDNIYETTQENIYKSKIAIIILSPSYLENELCFRELSFIANEEKRIIPIFVEGLPSSSLYDLPKNFINIKALSLADCAGEEDFNNKIALLAKNIIKQQGD